MPQISIAEFSEFSKTTDRFQDDEYTPILLGLYGEIGGVMSAVKKLKREDKAFVGFEKSVVEELGDAFWYFCALVRRYQMSVEEIFSQAIDDVPTVEKLVASEDSTLPIAKVQSPVFDTGLSDEALISLGKATSQLFDCDPLNKESARNEFKAFASCYLAVIKSSGIPFSKVLDFNRCKTISRFGNLDFETLPDFDIKFPPYEQLPREFRIEIFEKANKKVYLRYNDVFIGDPLTDNIKEPDWFRYHDVIHFAHAAVLHWSPTIRALIKHK
jgi:NTP pyrophosphatase (non-canonical NTP hydrolase)